MGGTGGRGGFLDDLPEAFTDVFGEDVFEVFEGEAAEHLVVLMEGAEGGHEGFAWEDDGEEGEDVFQAAVGAILEDFVEEFVVIGVGRGVFGTAAGVPDDLADGEFAGGGGHDGDGAEVEVVVAAFQVIEGAAALVADFEAGVFEGGDEAIDALLDADTG